MNILFKRLGIIVLTILSMLCYSQNDTSRTKVTVFEPFNTTTTINPKEDIEYTKNMIKWNLGMIVRGCFEIDYERTIAEKFSIEAGAGITYKDFKYVFFQTDNIYRSDKNVYKYGPLFTAGIRFYPEGVYNFEGIYFYIPFRYRSYFSDMTIEYFDASSSNIQTVTLKNNHKHFEYAFIVGYQTGNWRSVTFDYFFGVGINSVTELVPVIGTNGYPVQDNSQKKNPALFSGIKMGLPF